MIAILTLAPSCIRVAHRHPATTLATSMGTETWRSPTPSTCSSFSTRVVRHPQAGTVPSPSASRSVRSRTARSHQRSARCSRDVLATRVPSATEMRGAAFTDTGASAGPPRRDGWFPLPENQANRVGEAPRRSHGPSEQGAGQLSPSKLLPSGPCGGMLVLSPVCSPGQCGLGGGRRGRRAVCAPGDSGSRRVE